MTLRTGAGIARLTRHIKDLRDRIAAAKPNGFLPAHTELSMVATVNSLTQRLHCAEQCLSTLVPMPMPTQCVRVQEGNEVRIKYLDDSSRLKRGEEESFILGGPGENDVDSLLRTFASNSALGEAVLGCMASKPRERLYVEPPVGKPYYVRILSISIPAAEVFSCGGVKRAA